MTTVSSGFMTFGQEAPAVASAHMDFVRAHASASALDSKTEELAYLSVLAALRMTGGLAFHVAQAKSKGASREEVISAVLVGLPAAGLGVLDALPEAIRAWEQAES